MSPCRCLSTNNPSPDQDVPNVVLTIPERLRESYGLERTTVSVDACIAPAIEALWLAGIWTYGCCCGHGRPRGRSVCVDNHHREWAAGVVRAIGDDAEILAYELIGGDRLPAGVVWRHDAPHLWEAPPPAREEKPE